MKKVLISGGSGFVGQNLTAHLNQHGYEFSYLSRYKENKAGNNNIQWNELESLSRDVFDVYIHLAGKAHDLKKTADDSEYFIVNTELTKSFFDVFLTSNARDFIYFSSVKAVADTVDGILDENIKALPATPYGRSKQLAEAYLLSKQLPSDKRLFIIRPCMIHGPGNKGNLNLLYKVVEKGIPYPLAAFDNKRSFLSISNLNFIIERLIGDQSILGGVYNVADDDSLSTNEVIKIISEASALKPKLWKINSSIIRLLAKIGDNLKLPLNSERLKKLTESYVVSNNKIKGAIGVSKLPTSSKEGLLITIKSFRSI